MQKKTSKSAKSVRIIPLADRVLVRPFTEDEAKGLNRGQHFGIILPDSVTKEKSAQGKVIEVGPGKHVDGKLIPPAVKPGDIVIFSKYSYDEVELNGEELYLIKDENIFAVIK